MEKRIGVNEITDAREVTFFIQRLSVNHPSQDGNAVAAIEKIAIADTYHLSDFWFRIKILSGLNVSDVEYAYSSQNDGEHGIVAVHLATSNGVIRLD